MTVFTIFIFLFLGLMLLVILNRVRRGSANTPSNVTPASDDMIYHAHHLAPSTSHQPQSQGEVGGREMSHEPHSFDHGGDSGSGVEGAGY